MSCQIIIDQYCTLMRIAVVEKQKIIGFYLQNQLEPSKQDWIIQGRIEKVVKNLQGVFVNFGEEKNGLLHLTQIPACYEGKIQQGKKLPIQIKRENIGDKGHKLSANLNIKGDALICIPFENQTAFSKKIRDPQKKEAIKALIARYNHEGYGFMVRTKAAEWAQERLALEVQKLIHTTNQVMKSQQAVAPGSLLWQEMPLYVQIVKEQLGKGKTIQCISNTPQVKQMLKESIQPSECVEYKDFAPFENLFQLFSLEKEFESIFKHRIWLKNGGNIVIDHTEAMTVIDVNSAKATLSKDRKKSILELNQLAIEETVGQIIKRNLSGIILVDLVDCIDKVDRQILYEVANQCLKDYEDTRSKVYALTELDLLQIVRTKEYLPHRTLFMDACRSCGSGFKKTNEYFNLFRMEQHIRKMALNTDMKQIYLLAKKELKEYLQQQNVFLTFEEIYGIKIEIIENNKIEELYEFKYYAE